MTRMLASIVLVVAAGCTPMGGTENTAETSDSADSAGPACPTKGDWIAVEAGLALTCGIHADGCAECWGLGGDIELAQETGHGVYFDSGQDEPPRDIAFRSLRLVDVGNYGGPGYHGCGVTESSTVSCWGRNDYGQLAAPGGEFLDVEVYDRGSCGVRASGEIECWGETRPTPAGTFRSIAVSSGLAAALDVDGGVTSWPVSNVEIPGTPETAPGPYTRVDGGSPVAAIRQDGGVEVWSAGHFGEKHDLATLAPAGAFTAACARGDAACVLDAEGTIQCFGRYPDDLYLNVPKGVAFSSLSCGALHACGVTAERGIACWGDLSHGEGTPPD